jgi:general stress protein 26
MNWNEITPLMSGLAHMATATTDGQPHVAVVSAVVEGDTVWICTNRNSVKARNLRSNPQVSLMWARAAEVYMRGTVAILDDVAEKRRIWSSGLLPYNPADFFGTPENPDMVLLKVTPTSATVLTMGEQGPSVQRWKA